MFSYSKDPSDIKKYQACRKILRTCQREEQIDCFVANIGTDMEKEIPAAVRGKYQRKRRDVPKKKQTDIRAMLGVTAQVSSSKRQQNGVEVVEID